MMLPNVCEVEFLIDWKIHANQMDSIAPLSGTFLRDFFLRVSKFVRSKPRTNKKHWRPILDTTLVHQGPILPYDTIT